MISPFPIPHDPALTPTHQHSMGSNLLPPAPSSDAEAWGLFTSDTHSSPAMLQSSSLRAPQTRYGGRAAMQVGTDETGLCKH